MALYHVVKEHACSPGTVIWFNGIHVTHYVCKLTTIILPSAVTMDTVPGVVVKGG